MFGRLVRQLRTRDVPTDPSEGPATGDFADALFGGDSIYGKCAQDAAERFYIAHAHGHLSFYKHPGTRRWLVVLHDGASPEERMSLSQWCSGPYRQLVFEELAQLQQEELAERKG